MSPPCPSFSAPELPARIQQGADGRRRKLEGNTHRIELSACDLFKMNQWECELKDESMPHSPITCWPVTRFFRIFCRCKDKNGTFSVETTASEGKASGTSPPPSIAPDRTTTFQWTNHWSES
ncbi:hypothetical protein A9K55_001377 [Cordyceps militaris]|uniref:Uncharacterized protein n=1 Tax=Cordyceps militaris TaxID=73501 RepID=A0A2H4SQZ0_CORMI|nr:hypothetical protein A9K55_001377 [Cordyceps militaris]